MKRRTPLLAPLAALWLALPAAALYESPTVAPAPQSGPAAVILDPGHGGEDLGAVAGHSREKDIALSVARKVKQKLESLGGVPVKLTRDDDTYVPLDKRVGESLEWDGLAFISLHLNQTRSKKARGITVYAFGKQTVKLPSKKRHPGIAPLPNPPKDEAKISGELARAIVHSLRAQGFRVDAPAKAGFYVLKNPQLPSVLIELGYLSNPQERARLMEPAYQDRLAEAVAVSVRSYFLQSATASSASRAGVGGR